MPEETINIFVTEDGSIDWSQSAEHPALKKIRGQLDGYAGNVKQLSAIAEEAKAYKQLGSLETLTTWKTEAEAAKQLKDRVTELEGLTKMTDAEKQELEQLRGIKQKLGDVSPDDALAALQYKQQAERDKSISEAFKIAGYDPEIALSLDGVRSLETRVETLEGKAVPQVKINDKWQELKPLVETKFSKFLSVLTGKPANLGGPSNVGGQGVNRLNDLEGKLTEARKSGNTVAIAGLVRQITELQNK
jgi:hypothetical protein